MSPAGSWKAGLGRLGRLARKELSESLRDRRTILTLVLMPLLLYPLIALATQVLLTSRGAGAAGRPAYRVGLRTAAEANEILAYWYVGREARPEGEAPLTAAEMAKALGLDVWWPEVPIEGGAPDEALEAAVRNDAVDVGVRLGTPPKARRRGMQVLRAEIITREGGARGLEAAQYLNLLTSEANVRSLRYSLVRFAPDTPSIVFGTSIRAVPDEKPRESLLPVLMPLILVLMTMTGAVYPAIDLTAGERERGTLEILVAAPIPRLSVLLAKYVAVVTVSLLTALVNLGTMYVTLEVFGLGPQLFGTSLTLASMGQVLALLVLFALFFSGVLLALTSFARSFKEAQAYLIPLVLVCLAPGILSLMPGLSLRGPLAVVPLVNIVLLAQDVLKGQADLAAAGVVVTATLVYALAAVGLAARIFGTEAVLSSEQSGWSDVFSRPLRPAPRAELSSALLCLAVMFPIYFFLNAGLARVGGLSLAGRLGLAAAAQVALFAGVPAAAAWLARVEPVSGFRLHAPAAAAWGVALVLGVSLWPLVHQIIVTLQRLGVTTLSPEVLNRVREVLEVWRETSPIFLVVVLALLPAVLEELFFRGFLLEALAGEDRRAGRAIGGSAALFALFHLLVTDALAVERLAPSLMMGLVLGWLAWRSGSVWPGMLLHALHNSAVVLAGYYEPQLVEAGLIAPGAEDVPAWLLGAAGVGTALGLAGLYLAVRPRRRQEG